MMTENYLTTGNQPDSSSLDLLLPLSTIRSEGKKKKHHQYGNTLLLFIPPA
jgi:hypothetical protein